MSKANTSQEKAKVWYVNAECSFGYNWIKKIDRLWENTPLKDHIIEGDRVCIKTHFGAVGNTNHIRPFIVRAFVELVKTKTPHVVVAESTGLGYFTQGIYGSRCTGPSYSRDANANGFNQGTMGCPIYMLDGYFGTETVDQKIQGEYLNRVPVALGVKDFDKIIVLSHFKGHGIAGFGGAIKNVGIGMVGKEGKGMMHSDGKININSDLCLGKDCAQPCIHICPKECMVMEDSIVIDHDRCIVCSMCADVCRAMFREKGDNETRVLQMAWTNSRDDQTLKMVELAKGVIGKVGKKKFIYVNVALDVAQHCDCVNIASPHLVGDQGIFVSRDILAVDKACYDQVKEAEGLPLLTGEPIPAGEDKFTIAHPKVDPETKEKTPTFHHLLQFKHGKKMKLGTTEYTIKQVDKGC